MKTYFLNETVLNSQLYFSTCQANSSHDGSSCVARRLLYFLGFCASHYHRCVPFHYLLQSIQSIIFRIYNDYIIRNNFFCTLILTKKQFSYSSEWFSLAFSTDWYICLLFLACSAQKMWPLISQTISNVNLRRLWLYKSWKMRSL